MTNTDTHENRKTDRQKLNTQDKHRKTEKPKA